MKSTRAWIAAAGLGAIGLLILLFVFRSPRPETAERPKLAPEKPIVNAPLPLEPHPPAASKPAPIEEAAVERKKRFEEMHKKDPPLPIKEERIRWTGPLSLITRVMAAPASGSGPAAAKDVPSLYLSQLPIPVELWIARVPLQELPQVPAQLASWKAALSVRMASDSEPKNYLSCNLELVEIRRGIGAERIDGSGSPIDFPEAGVSLRGTVQPSPAFRIPGKFFIQAALDANVLLGTEGKWDIQESPKVPLQLLQENSSNDRLNILASQVQQFIGKGEYDKAIEASQTLIRERPTSVAAHYDLATALWKKGQDVNQAIAMMERALQILERGLDPDPDYQRPEPRVRKQMLSNMQAWIAARRRELADSPTQKKDDK